MEETETTVTTAASASDQLTAVSGHLNGLADVMLYAMVGLLVVSVIAEFVNRAMDADEDKFDVQEWKRKRLQEVRLNDEWDDYMDRENGRRGM